MPDPAHPLSAARRQRIVWGAIAVALVLALACYAYGVQHRNHVAQALTWLLILACPLMHMFGHRHHHRHGRRERPEASRPHGTDAPP